MLESLFNKAADLKACNLMKKWLQSRFFQVEFAKFLKTPILRNICGTNYVTETNEQDFKADNPWVFIVISAIGFNQKTILVISLQPLSVATMAHIYHIDFIQNNEKFIARLQPKLMCTRIIIILLLVDYY